MHPSCAPPKKPKAYVNAEPDLGSNLQTYTQPKALNILLSPGPRSIHATGLPMKSEFTIGVELFHSSLVLLWYLYEGRS